jgi:chemotaxis protein methyltransferase CheR
MPLTYQEFKEAASRLCGNDLSLYKSKQMDRRIHSLMNIWGVSDYDEYLTILQTDPQRYQEFVKKLTINVSEFFRNPDRFMELWERIMPELLKKPGKIKIWSAGCSNGSEPYSVAIILHELCASTRAEILATDIDQVVLDKAKKGVYLQNEIKSMPPDLIKKHFRQEGEAFYLKENIKERVVFKKHNLLKDPFEKDLDLIICRNVVIYFTEQAKNDLYIKFNQSLRMGGYFLVGGTEPLLYYKQLGYENVSPSFYKKIGEPKTDGMLGGLLFG